MDEKIVDSEQLAAHCAVWRKNGLKVVFTSGVFDIVHRGHLTLLREASKLGDVLVVAINSDASVRRKKGDKRPINVQEDRAFLLSQLHVVTAVIIFDEPDNQPTELLAKIVPDYVVKSSGEWTAETMLGKQLMSVSGGHARLLGHTDGYSTSTIINRILERYRD